MNSLALLPQCTQTYEQSKAVWADNVRVAPSSLLNSALFAIAKQPTPEKYLSIECSIPTANKTTIEFSGELLTESDLDVWLEIIHQFRHQLFLQDEVLIRSEFSSRYMLRQLKRHESSGRNSILLRDSIKRLHKCHVNIYTSNLHYSGSLLSMCESQHKTKDIAVLFDHNIRKFIMKDAWTKLDPLVRRQLHRKPLASWLYRFYSTYHETTINLHSVSELKVLSSSMDPNLFGFRRNLKQALSELFLGAGWVCWIGKEDNVFISKHPSKHVC